MELLDVLDADGRPVGVKPRDAVHRDGDWHRCFHLWVVTGDGVLLQRRGRGKRAFPGMLDATAAGHLTAGEAVADGVREVQEELGVSWPMTALTDLGVHRVDDRPTPDTINRELQHVFAVRDDRPLTSYDGLHPEELDGLVQVTHAGLAALLHGGEAEAREWDGRTVRDVRVQPTELVPAPYLPGVAPRLADL